LRETDSGDSDLAVKPVKLGGSVCSRLVAWAASGINRQIVSHVLKNGRIRQGSCWSARNFITAFCEILSPLVEQFTALEVSFGGKIVSLLA
jgi:hypothetical protein